METLDIKEALHHIADELPPEANLYDALERLYLLAKTKTALEQIKRGETTTHDQIKQKVASWFK